MPKPQHFEIAYVGRQLDDGSMDVTVLGPALHGLGNLYIEANRQLNGDRALVNLRVTAFAPGSFQIDFELVQTILSKVKTVFWANPITTAKELAETIGVYTKGAKDTGLSLLRAAQFLKGNKIKKAEQLPSGDVAVETEDGRVANFKGSTFILIQNSVITNSLNDVLRPLEEEGIDGFEVRSGPKVLERIDKEDLPSFRALTRPEPSEEKPLLVSSSEGLFQVVSLTFREENKWKLSYAGHDYWVTITDPSFTEKFLRHEVTFGYGDILRARFTMDTFRAAKGELKVQITITEVLDIIPPPRPQQTSLLEDEGTGE